MPGLILALLLLGLAAPAAGVVPAGDAERLGQAVGPFKVGVLFPAQRTTILPPTTEPVLLTYALAGLPMVNPLGPHAQWVYTFCNVGWDPGCTLTYERAVPASYAGYVATPGSFDLAVGIDLAAHDAVAYVVRFGQAKVATPEVCPEPTPVTNLCYGDDLAGP